MPVPAAAGEPEAWLTLDLIPGLGGESLRNLLKAFGSPANVLTQTYSGLKTVVSGKIAQAIVDGAEPEKLSAALNWLAHDNNHLLTLADTDYPRALLEIPDPPPVLYLKGRRALLALPGIAIVGSRNATPSGALNANAFAKVLCEAGLNIISGMALGIDTAAHRGGLDAANTCIGAASGTLSASSIAVVGTGLDLIYPSRNKALAHELAEKGLLVSEFSLGTPALAQNFPRRNRIISGLSRGVLVVEAALASGSLITARLAAEQGRDVFAIPGSIHSPFSKGSHQLIKQGAKLVDDANDILEELGLHGIAKTASTPTDDDPILSAMGFDAVSLDALLERVDGSTESILARLSEFEINGQIASLPGGKYQRLS